VPDDRPEGPDRRPRPARPDDVAEILRLVRELAAYERSLDQVVATTADVDTLLFDATSQHGAPAAFCHVVDGDGPGHLAAFALWFLNTSTWLGRHGVYLEDLYVSPAYRGRGYGQALMAELAAVAVRHGYRRLEWWVLDWNQSAIDFYRSLGAEAMDEWTVHRLAGDALADLASRAAPGHHLAPTLPAEDAPR
jgi:ribosomal protein S18 acetylase RimI-like enzyme